MSDMENEQERLLSRDTELAIMDAVDRTLGLDNDEEMEVVGLEGAVSSDAATGPHRSVSSGAGQVNYSNPSSNNMETAVGATMPPPTAPARLPGRGRPRVTPEELERRRTVSVGAGGRNSGPPGEGNRRHSTGMTGLARGRQLMKARAELNRGEASGPEGVTALQPATTGAAITTAFAANTATPGPTSPTMLISSSVDGSPIAHRASRLPDTSWNDMYRDWTGDEDMMDTNESTAAEGGNGTGAASGRNHEGNQTSDSVFRREPEVLRADEPGGGAVTVDLTMEDGDEVEEEEEDLSAEVANGFLDRIIALELALPIGTYRRLNIDMYEDVASGEVLQSTAMESYIERIILFRTKCHKDIIVTMKCEPTGALRLLKGTIRLIPYNKLPLLKTLAAIHRADTLEMRAAIRQRDQHLTQTRARMREEAESRAKHRLSSSAEKEPRKKPMTSTPTRRRSTAETAVSATQASPLTNFERARTDLREAVEQLKAVTRAIDTAPATPSPPAEATWGNRSSATTHERRDSVSFTRLPFDGEGDDGAGAGLGRRRTRSEHRKGGAISLREEFAQASQVTSQGGIYYTPGLGWRLGNVSMPTTTNTSVPATPSKNRSTGAGAPVPAPRLPKVGSGSRTAPVPTPRTSPRSSPSHPPAGTVQARVQAMETDNGRAAAAAAMPPPPARPRPGADNTSRKMATAARQDSPPRSSNAGDGGARGGAVATSRGAGGGTDAPTTDDDNVPWPGRMSRDERLAYYRREVGRTLDQLERAGVSRGLVDGMGGELGRRGQEGSSEWVRVTAGPRPNKRPGPNPGSQAIKKRGKTYAQIARDTEANNLEVYYASKELCDSADLKHIRTAIGEWQRRWVLEDRPDNEMLTVEAVVLGGGAVRMAAADERTAAQLRRLVLGLAPAHAEKGPYQVWPNGQHLKPYQAYTVRVDEANREELERTPLYIQKLNPTLRGGRIKFVEIIRTRIPNSEGMVVRLMVEDILIPEVEKLQGSVRGIGGLRWTLLKAGPGEDPAAGRDMRAVPPSTRTTATTTPQQRQRQINPGGNGVAQSSRTHLATTSMITSTTTTSTATLGGSGSSGGQPRDDGVNQTSGPTARQDHHGPVGGHTDASHHGSTN